jgi:hypothetical protein
MVRARSLEVLDQRGQYARQVEGAPPPVPMEKPQRALAGKLGQIANRQWTEMGIGQMRQNDHQR